VRIQTNNRVAVTLSPKVKEKTPSVRNDVKGGTAPENSTADAAVHTLAVSERKKLKPGAIAENVLIVNVVTSPILA